jgi:hypothetical protein
MPQHLRALAGLERPWLLDAATFAGIRTAWGPLARALDLPQSSDASIARLRAFAATRPFDVATARREARKAS